jgi:superfamily I DNA and/or RNA helicase
LWIVDSQNSLISCINVGKTTTIVEIVKEIACSSGDRILVCAETNLAVDNLALRMLDDQTFSPGDLIRVGSGEKVDNKLKAIHLEAMVKGKLPNASVHVAHDSEPNFYLSRHKKIMHEILTGARVIFATTIGAGDPNLNGQKFEFVVMDEASMSTEPSCLPALSHGCSRFVMVGDHKQLGPHACDSKCVSLFERLLLETESNVIPAATTMLNQQHRMHSKLCEFPSNRFYDGKLLTACGVDNARKIPHVIFNKKSPIMFIPVKDGKEQRMKSGSWYNEVEIGYVLQNNQGSYQESR